MKQVLIIISFIYIGILSATAQNGIYNKFVHLSTVDGLSQSSAITITQDRLGQIWIGTRDGLNKYDGSEITVFRNIPGDSTSICSNDILSIQEDTDGYIWIGTYNGLNRYDPRKNTFKSYVHSLQEGSISDNTIWDITLSKNGELWIGSSNGLMLYDKINDRFITLKNNPTDPNSLSNNYILSIFEDSKQQLWIGTANGLNKQESRNGTHFTFSRFFKSTHQNGLSDSHIKDIVEDKDGVMWIGTKYGGLNYYSTTEKTFSQIKTTSDGTEINNDIRNLAIDKKGNLWLATYNGLYIRNTENKITHVTHQPGNPKGLSRNTLKTLFIDKKGTVWIGSYYGGVNIWDESNSNFVPLLQNNAGINSTYGVVSCIAEDAERGTIYFGTEGKGISILNTNNHTNTDLETLAQSSLPSTNIKSLLLDKNELWIGTYNAGVVVYDIEKNSIKPGITNPEIQNTLKEAGVYAIEKTGDELLLGTFGNGIISYNLTNNNENSTKRGKTISSSLSDTHIRTLHIDQKNNLWIGTQNGLNLVRNINLDEHHVVERYFFNEKQASGDNILAIFEDQKGQIYVSTKGDGVHYLKNNKFERLEPQSYDTKINTVFGITEDTKGKIWMSSNKGVMSYDQNTKKTVLYDQSNGISGNEFSNNACIKSKDGNLYFGGPSGVFFLNPNTTQENHYTPQVILTELKSHGKIITPATKNTILEQSISYTKEINLNHNQESFSIRFAIPNFINSTNNKYAYRLVEFNKEWQYSDRPEVNYTIQKSGNYTFEVKGANNHDVWNTKPTTLKIRLKPAPWKSPWAIVTYILIACAILFGINHINKSKTALKHKLELEHLESLQLEKNNQSKLEFFTNISHEFRTPLALIIAPLQQLITHYQGSNKMYKQLLVIERNADQLLKLINQLIDFRKFENKHSKLQAAKGNLVKFLKEIHLSFDEYAKIGNYTYTFTSQAENVTVYFDRFKLERVFYNLISNAFKYTPDGGKITVNITETKTEAIIEVTDNGNGIDTDFVTKVFERFYEVAGDKDYQKQFNQGSGIGLSIAKKAVDLHLGLIEIDSKKGEGTTFRVRLKKGKKHLKEEDIIKDFKISDDIEQYKAQLSSDIYKELDYDQLISEEDKPVVLIAEDNDELRNFMVNLLQQHYRVEQANNGESAFKKALQKSPDLIISDVIMPKMEGTVLCSKIKNDIRTSHIPFILLTSRTSLIYKLDGLESGADAYLNKPFNVKEFFLTIKNLLLTRAKLKEKFTSNTSSSSDFAVTSLDEKLFKKAIKIVEENISNNSFDIPYFSSELGVSRTMLFTKIKGWTNLTPNEFIHSIRMKRATQLLELGQINISEVCYKVGFRNPKYFTKCFKKHFNQTPSEYASKFYN